MALVTSIATLLAYSGCSNDGGTDIADMAHKVLYLDGNLAPGGYLGIELAADGCPLLHRNAFIRVNGVSQSFSRGDNSGPGPFEGPCYSPEADDFSLPEIGTAVTVEVGDDSETVRAVLEPYAAGPIHLMPPFPTKAAPGGEVVISFALSGGTMGAPLPYAYADFEDETGVADWQGPASVDAATFRFKVPATAATKTQNFRVQAGVVGSCANAECQTLWLKVGADFQPPPANVVFPLSITAG
jgi:hypothetical protein